MTEKLHRVVLDTNVLVAGLIVRSSKPALAIRFAVRSSAVLLSSAVLEELDAVFRRRKFNRYQDLDTRLQYLCSFVETSLFLSVTHTVTDCRDPRDNIFLELALSGNADAIVTGDADLLCLHPWRGIAILSPGEYLALAARYDGLGNPMETSK